LTALVDCATSTIASHHRRQNGETAMSGFSVFYWIAVILYIGLIFVFFRSLVRILNRAGYSGWWSLLAMVPIGNIIGLWQFSKAPWPAAETKKIGDVF
jgi:uncharacterized membrane protein YhaH (DUF805 family)